MDGTDTDDLGVSIKKSVEFIASVHSETQVLLMEISGKIQAFGLEPLRGAALSVPESSTKNAEAPGGWCHRAIARCFGNGGKNQSSDRFVTVEVHFAPAFSDRAVLVLGYAHFPEEHSREALKQAYEGWWMGRTYSKHPLNFDEATEAVASDASRLFQTADVLRVIAWPLVSFDNGQKVETTITRALSQLGLPENV